MISVEVIHHSHEIKRRIKLRNVSSALQFLYKQERILSQVS